MSIYRTVPVHGASRPVREPAGDRVPVVIVGLAEPVPQSRLFIAGDQPVARGHQAHRAQEQPGRAEQPRLPAAMRKAAM